MLRVYIFVYPVLYWEDIVKKVVKTRGFGRKKEKVDGHTAGVAYRREGFQTFCTLRNDKFLDAQSRSMFGK